MHRILFHIGNLPVYSYGAMISLAVLVAAIFMSRESSREGIDPDNTLEAIIVAVIGGLLGSRILYVILNWEYYRGRWQDIYFGAAGARSTSSNLPTWLHLILSSATPLAGSAVF